MLLSSPRAEITKRQLFGNAGLIWVGGFGGWPNDPFFRLLFSHAVCLGQRRRVGEGETTIHSITKSTVLQLSTDWYIHQVHGRICKVACQRQKPWMKLKSSHLQPAPRYTSEKVDSALLEHLQLGVVPKSISGMYCYLDGYLADLSCIWHSTPIWNNA